MSFFENTRKPVGLGGKIMVAMMNLGHSPVARWGLQFLNAAPDAKVLDCGCGGGANIKRLLKKCPEGIVKGIDYSPVSVEREACQLHEKCSDLAGKRVPCMGEGRRDEHTVILQHPLDFLQGFLRLRHDVQCVGHDHHIKGLIRIGQAEHILHGEVQLCRSVIPLCFGDHLRGGVRRLDVRRRVYDVFCDQSRAGRKLQHRLGFYNRPDQCIHLVIRRPILSHKAVIPPGIFVPEILVFLHLFHSFQC